MKRKATTSQLLVRVVGHNFTIHLQWFSELYQACHVPNTATRQIAPSSHENLTPLWLLKSNLEICCSSSLLPVVLIEVLLLMAILNSQSSIHHIRFAEGSEVGVRAVRVMVAGS